MFHHCSDSTELKLVVRNFLMSYQVAAQTFRDLRPADFDRRRPYV